MAVLHGPLEVWGRLVPESAEGNLPVRAGWEELHAFVDVAMPQDDATAHPDYLPVACGLTPGNANPQGSDSCLREAWALLGALQASGSQPYVVSSAEQEATVLAQIRQIEDQLQGLALTVSRCALEPEPAEITGQGGVQAGAALAMKSESA